MTRFDVIPRFPLRQDKAVKQFPDENE